MTEKRGRKPKNDVAMTDAERKRASRKAKRAALTERNIAALPPSLKPQSAVKPARRQRSDSAAAAVRAMVNASKDYPRPPAHVPLSQSAIPFWNAIMESRAVDDWNEVDLISAANLAQCQADFVDENEKLRIDGRTFINGFGEVKIHPRAKIVEDLTRRSMALMRTLRMGGKAAGDPRNLAKARTLEAESRGIRAEVEDEEGLLA